MKKMILIIFGLILLAIVIYAVFPKRSDKIVNSNIHSATAIALQKINENSQHKMAIKETKENPDGWVFYYDSEQAVKTGDWQTYGVPGNVPLFVGKDGSVKYLPGSKLTIEAARDLAVQSAIKEQVTTLSSLENNRCISFLEQKDDIATFVLHERYDGVCEEDPKIISSSRRATIFVDLTMRTVRFELVVK